MWVAGVCGALLNARQRIDIPPAKTTQMALPPTMACCISVAGTPALPHHRCENLLLLPWVLHLVFSLAAPTASAQIPVLHHA